MSKKYEAIIQLKNGMRYYLPIGSKINQNDEKLIVQFLLNGDNYTYTFKNDEIIWILR